MDITTKSPVIMASLGLLILFLLTSSYTSRDTYRVEVKIRMGNNCSSTTQVLVEANSSFEARKKAENLARFFITVESRKTTKVNK